MDDRNLISKLKAEKEAIARWGLEGLKRLKDNNFHFSISKRALENLEESKKDDDNIIDFFESEGYIHFQEDMEMPVKEIYEIYTDWCEANLEKPRAMNSFSKFMKKNAEQLGLTYIKNLKLRNGKSVRGYRGLSPHPGRCPFEDRQAGRQEY